MTQKVRRVAVQALGLGAIHALGSQNTVRLRCGNSAKHSDYQWLNVERKTLCEQSLFIESVARWVVINHLTLIARKSVASLIKEDT